MRNILCLLIVLSAGCASVGVKRDIHNASGVKIGTIKADGELLTPDGAAQILASVQLFERTKLDGEAEARRDKLDGEAEARVARVAEMSVEKGEPTTVATRGGKASSGFIGYGPYDGAISYGYGAYDPSVAQEFVAIEAAGRMGGYLPPLGTPVVTGVQTTPLYHPSGMEEQTPVACPTDRTPTSLEERVACNTAATNALLKARATRARRK